MSDMNKLPDLDHIAYLEKALDVARRALANGKHPFGAILVGPEGRC